MPNTESHRSSHMVAWAIPVHTGEALARLEAYVLSKPVISTLSLCILHSSTGRALGRVPPEIVLVIAEWLRVDLFGRDSWEKLSLYSKWNGLKLCLEDRCSPNNHWSAKEFREHWAEREPGTDMPSIEDCFGRNLDLEHFDPDNYGPDLFDDTGFDYNLWPESHRWQDSLEDESTDYTLFSSFELLHLLGLRTGGRSSGRVVEKYNQILEQDFGLRLYSMYFHESSEGEGDLYRVLSYLVYSGTHGEIATNIHRQRWGTHVMHLHTEFVELEQLPRWSKKLQRKFDRASNFFKLSPWIEPMNIPIDIAKKHGFKEENRVGNYCYSEERSKDVQKLEQSQWPKVTVLTHAEYDQD